MPLDSKILDMVQSKKDGVVSKRPGPTQINHDYRIWKGWQPVSHEVEAPDFNLTQPPPIFFLFHILRLLVYNTHIVPCCNPQYEFLQPEDQDESAP